MSTQQQQKIAEARAQAEKIAEQRRLAKENLSRLSSQPVEQEEVEEPEEEEQQGEAVAAGPEEVEEALPEEPRVKETDWEHKYRSADGLLKQQGEQFRAAKAELLAKAQEAEQRAKQLEAEMAELRDQMEATRPVGPEDLKKYFTAEQIERLGEDECRELLSVQRTIAQDNQKVTRKSIQAEIASIREDVNREREALAQTRQQAFWDAVTAAVPNWREIDAKPEFEAWLLERDDLSGRTRKKLGEEARDSLDVKRFASFFKSFMMTQAKPVANKPKRVLPNGVAPADTTTAEGRKAPPVSLEEIQRYKNKHARGYYLTRPEELKRDRARILSAMPQRGR